MQAEFLYDGETLAELKALVPQAQTMSGVSFEGPARKVGAILKLAALSGDFIERIEYLEAEMKEVAAMANLLSDREWAEHVGRNPVSSALEIQITKLMNELSAAKAACPK